MNFKLQIVGLYHNKTKKVLNTLGNHLLILKDIILLNIITIHVHSILNSKLATTSDHSDLLFEEIKGKLKSFNLVEVNFSNVSVMNFNFTSALVRRLYIEQIEINSLLFIGLTPSQKRLFSTTKELTLQKIGKSNKTKYPETKDEIIFFFLIMSILLLKLIPLKL